jgi:hypothetical protein
MGTTNSKLFHWPNDGRGIASRSSRDDRALPVEVNGSDRRIQNFRPSLQSWKEIASELQRGVRTVQRWEKTLGLPVRRVGKGHKSPVFAFRDELQDWLRKRSEECHPGNKTSPTRLTLVRQTKPPDARLLQSIRELIASGSTQGEQTCNRCQSPMQLVEGHFWIHGTNIKWQIPLAICPVCDAESRLLKPLRVQ